MDGPQAIGARVSAADDNHSLTGCKNVVWWRGSAPLNGAKPRHHTTVVGIEIIAVATALLC